MAGARLRDAVHNTRRAGSRAEEDRVCIVCVKYYRAGLYGIVYDLHDCEHDCIDASHV